jgi:hypothetical protein
MPWLSRVTQLPLRLLGVFGVSAKRRNAFSSFRAYLPELVRYTRPERVLEFGPGSSSRIILDNSAAQVLSFETHAGYFEKARKEFASERFDVRYTPAPTDLSELAGRSFDLVFVDGGDRVANLLGAHELLGEQGVAVLHDAHREDYLPGVRRYEYGYFIENHSLLLFKNRARFLEIRGRFPAVDRCHCKYCGTAPRIQYRQQLARELAHD